MAKPIPEIDLRNISKTDNVKSEEEISFIDDAINRIPKKSSRDLLLECVGQAKNQPYCILHIDGSIVNRGFCQLGTLGGWVTGICLTKLGKVAAVGLGGGVILLHYAIELGYVHVNWERIREAVGRSQDLIEWMQGYVRRNSCFSVGFVGGYFFGMASKLSKPNEPAVEDKSSLPSEAIIAPVTTIPKIIDPFKPEDPPPFLEKPFIPPKILHSPKISPSSIPNPNPSVTTTKQGEPGYPNYGSFMYSMPGYSAFQPVAYPGVVQPSSAALSQKEVPSSDFNPFPVISNDGIHRNPTEKITEHIINDIHQPIETVKPQEEFEDHFTPEVIPDMPSNDTNNVETDSQITVTSMSQGSGAVVTIPTLNKEIKKKPPERFSLKTSIPISKIDMKCVNNSPDIILQNTTKKPFNPAFHTPKSNENGCRIEIQSNIIVKSALKELEPSQIATAATSAPNNSIRTLINAAEAINKTENFRKPETQTDVSSDIRDSSFTVPSSNLTHRHIFNPINTDTSKENASTKPQEPTQSETKNQIVFIQNKNPTNSKMLLTIQQQNSQVLVQRSTYDSKNLQAPSRLSSQSKKCKEELVKENGTSSKVVSLKRLHQENCDENDFENLITENQIYGNKIVVKEKSQGTSQEQDLKNKIKADKTNQPEAKNVVLQPNFLYLSNVQFPANLMMIKNNSKMSNDSTNIRVSSNDSKPIDVVTTTSSTDTTLKSSKTTNATTNQEIHVLKSNNNVLQTVPNQNTKSDLVFQTSNQKVIMNSQIVYQVPMIMDADNKISQTFVSRDLNKIIGQTEFQKPFDQSKSDKLFIACPYQIDSKLQPKIVITNIRPKIAPVEEISALDMYEKRKRLRRLKYLSNRDVKSSQTVESQKPESKKTLDNSRNIITPDKIKSEIYKEFANFKVTIDQESSDNDSDYEENEIREYHSIIKEFGPRKKRLESKENLYRKAEFLSNFRLASQDEFKDRELDRQERVLQRDSVAAAYIAAGRIDCLVNESCIRKEPRKMEMLTSKTTKHIHLNENDNDQRMKQSFLSCLNLTQVTKKHRDDYERVWQEVLKERTRRELPAGAEVSVRKKQLNAKDKLDPDGQLEILTEIKKHVNENNNLIKKRLDSHCGNGDSIRVLADKNFSQLNRLSIMADRSVKHFSGQDTRKRDLTPGFDSENIKKLQPNSAYHKINIPNISKIISLKTTQTPCAVTSTQATSMDEPVTSAAGAGDACEEPKVKDFCCQFNDMSWLDIESMIKLYKERDIARKKEIADLHKRNTALRVESAYITRAASQDSDRARALLAERKNLANEERTVRNSIRWLCALVDIIRNFKEV